MKLVIMLFKVIVISYFLDNYVKLNMDLMYNGIKKNYLFVWCNNVNILL